jgi:DNA-directed RNA polymerase subunit beta
MGSNGVVRLGS